MTNRELLKTLNKVAKKNIGNAVFSYFLMSLIVSMVTAFLTAGLFDPNAGQDKGGIFLISAGISFFLVLLFFLLFQFGYTSMIFQMTRDRPSKFSYIFLGFRNLRKTLPVCMIFILFAVIFYSASFLLSFYVVEPMVEGYFLSKFEFLDSMMLVLLVSAMIFGVFALIFGLPAIFTFQYRLDNGSRSSWYALGKSYALSFSRLNIFRLIGFAFMAAFKNYLIAFVAIFLMALLGAGEKSSLAVHLAQFIYFVNIFTATVKNYMAVSVFYNDKSGAWKENPIEEVTLVSDEE